MGNQQQPKHKFKQEPHKLLVIPGPTELADDVLYANAHPSVSHMSPEFSACFQECLSMIRQVLYTKSGQPFLISGSGTLGWDQVSANLIEPGEDVLVCISGYFGDSFADCLETYGAKVTPLRASVGDAVSPSEVIDALKEKSYKAVTITHVDTSTGVLADVRGAAAAVREHSPETLVIVDAVCSVASEELRFDDWDIDVVLSAPQKGLGAPPGLSILMVSERAMQVFHLRTAPITSYYASWKRWLPIMAAYDKGSAAYFATPPVNLIHAFHASLKTITSETLPLEERLRLHKQASAKFKSAIAELGLKQLPVRPEVAANGMSAVYFPDGVESADVVPKLAQKDIVISGGLLKGIASKYFRIGHMGVSVVDESRGDVDKVIAGVKEVITAARNGKQ